VVAVAAAGLTMLSAGSAAARPALSATSTAQGPLLALIDYGENSNPDIPLCDAGAMALRVDNAGNLMLNTYGQGHESGCRLEQTGPTQIDSGWGDVTQIFAEPFTGLQPTGTVFAIDTAGELTAYTVDSSTPEPTLSAGTVIGTGWNNFTHVTYAGNGVFYAVRGDGSLFWYQDLDVAGRTADWANGGAGAIIGTGWQNFPLVFAAGGAIYASTTDGNLLWYGYSDPTSDSGTWAANSGAVVDSGGWDTVVAATADPGRVAGHVLIDAVGPDGNVRYYDHLSASTGGTTWSSVSGLVVLPGWTD
jgi:hypothetical protein